jgi:zinc protease
LRRLVPVVAALLVTGVAPLAPAQSAAPRDAQESQTAATPSAPPATSTAQVLPQKVDPILESYARAIGGRPAWEKFTSQVLMGTIEVPSMGLTGTILIHEKAPNKFMSAVIVNGAVFRQGFDGTQGWTDDPKNGLRDQTGAELAESKRGADFLHAFRMGRAYAKIEVTGAEKIGDRDTWIVEATAPEGGEPTKMYFDTQTGLMLRVISQNHDADGVSQLQEDFEDYRVVDSVRVPFVWRQTNGDTTYTLKFSEVHHNVELPDSEFAKPAAQ